MIDYPTEEERNREAQRLLEGLSSQWVADRMSTDVNFTVKKSTVLLWRNGKRVPNLENLLRIRDATGRPLDPAIESRLLFGKTAPASIVPVKDREEISG